VSGWVELSVALRLNKHCMRFSLEHLFCSRKNQYLTTYSQWNSRSRRWTSESFILAYQPKFR